MATTIDNIGDGNGYLYCADLAGVLISADKNNADGIRNMRNLGIGASPIAANKSAVGSVEITSCASSGAITSVTVDGNELLAGPYSVTTNNVATEAQGLAAAINANTPGAGYKYFAYNILGVCYLQAPQSVGTLANGLAVDATANTGSIVMSATATSGGADSTNVTDDVSGRRFYLDAVGTSTAIGVNAIEITKYIIVRGLNSGLISKTKSIANDAIGDIDRSSALENIYLEPQSGTSDVLVFIDPSSYIDGDIVIIKTADDANTITVQDYNSTSSPFQKNIFLTEQTDCVLSDRTKTVTLQYQYNPVYGGIFVELCRSLIKRRITLTKAEMGVILSNSAAQEAMEYEITDATDYEIALIVEQLRPDTLCQQAFDPLFPEDTVLFDFDLDAVTYRKDNTKQLSAYWDWRYKKHTAYFKTFDFSGYSFPITPVSIETGFNGVVPFGHTPELATMEEVDWFLTGVAKGYIYGVNIQVSKVTGKQVQWMTPESTSDLIAITFNDGSDAPVTISAQTTQDFYTFGNTLTTDTAFTPAANGNGGSCTQISIGKYALKAIIGDNCNYIDINGDWVIFNDCQLIYQRDISTGSWVYQGTNFITLIQSAPMQGCKGGSTSTSYGNNLGFAFSPESTNRLGDAYNQKAQIYINSLVADVSGSNLLCFERISGNSFSSTFSTPSGTINKIQCSSDPAGQPFVEYLKIEPNEGESLTINCTAVASLSAFGQIVGDVASIVLVGDNKDYAILELFSLEGVAYYRVTEYKINL